MALRTDEQLKQLFDKIKLSQQRKKEREKQHYKKVVVTSNEKDDLPF